jgi:caa(3)-type oxidase subunit IV
VSEQHVVPIRIYWVIATLLLMTLVTVDVAFYNVDLMNLPIALAVATTKATRVILYFMHVRYAPSLTPGVRRSRLRLVGDPARVHAERSPDARLAVLARARSSTFAIDVLAFRTCSGRLSSPRP